MKDKRILIYWIDNMDLPRASEVLTREVFYGDSMEIDLKSKIKEVITGDLCSIIIIEVQGTRANLENDWIKELGLRKVKQ